MKKRSSHVALVILGAAAFSLAGCTEEQVEAQAFPDLKSCQEAAGLSSNFTAADCTNAFAEAAALNVEAAPRYDSLAACEQQHGPEACASEQQAQPGGSGSIFMPLMMGYLIGNMMGGGRGVATAQPLYKTSDGKFTNAAGSSVYSSNTGKGKLSANQFARPASTIDKPPMSAATAKSRGGFGTSKSVSSS